MKQGSYMIPRERCRHGRLRALILMVIAQSLSLEAIECLERVEANKSTEGTLSTKENQTWAV